MNKNWEKSEALKVGGVQTEEIKGKKHILLAEKDYFSSYYFFIATFRLHFKDDF